MLERARPKAKPDSYLRPIQHPRGSDKSHFNVNQW